MDFMDDMPVGAHCQRCQQKEELMKSDIFESLSQLLTDHLLEIAGSEKKPVCEQARGFRHRLKQQITELCHFRPKSELIQRFTECVEGFVISVEEEVKTNHSLTLAAAYYIMNEASKEVSKIVSPVFQGDWRKAHSLTIRLFYSIVFKPCKSELDSDPEINQIEEEIGEFIPIDGSNPLQDMGIEELLTYINSPSEKKQRKKKKPRQKQEDFEVESFKKKLNEEVAAPRKLVPVIDHNYINKWRTHLIRSHRLTTN